MLGLIRSAQVSDAIAIQTCVMVAYEQYIARIGKPPGPMLNNYAEVVAEHLVWVIEDDSSTAGQIVGVLVLIEKAGGILLDNVAVHPARQGQGLGRRLIAFAEIEAKRRGYADIQLYTNILMTENIRLYQNLGYVELARRRERGYDRVYMQKRLIDNP
ncbi:GNAT family N-acetyltransferase [Chloroflexi bacterium TSY]|nr:GNAT family N-acetyltransferase [Chloroflexi bacterium TSY]